MTQDIMTQARPSSDADTKQWTTNAGAPVMDNRDSLSVGKRGPVLLEDYHLLEKLAQFDRERIPERVVHARGATAKGHFTVTNDITHLTKAHFLGEVGRETPVIARFSTVIHERGSPETLRDIRGFSIKFYTQEGNYDFVGNNMPVFFIRDGMSFPDMVHALKPNPKNHIQEWWRILDFFAHHPESTHTFSWLLDDAGIPQDYRHMRGFGVHTYTLINADGDVNYVKFHWIPEQEEKFLLDDEAIQVGGRHHSHATHDLFNAIEDGNFPAWKLMIQTMDPDTENGYDFDPLDATKVWPEEQFPLQEVGRLELNKNIDNFFNENEMTAFNPALVVPGIGYSADKLLQSRLFSYADTQRYRLGANYLELPVNAPKCPFHNNHYDGAMNTVKRSEEIDYFPTTFVKDLKEAAPFPLEERAVNGSRTKAMIDKENNFKQAGERFNSFDDERKERFIGRVVMKLKEPRVTNEIRNIWVGYWKQADKVLGERIAEALAKENML